MKKTVSAVIVAAGKSTRMGQNKILMKILGKSVLLHTVEAILKTDIFSEVIVVASAENIPLFEAELCKMHGVRVIAGGETRGESAYRGICQAGGEYVLIHDGARPMVTDEIIKTTVEKAVETGAAAAGVVPKDTIKVISDDNSIKHTVDRKSAVAIQTPQVFEKQVYGKALETAKKNGFVATDDSSLVSADGVNVNLCDTPSYNIKITYTEDVFLAQAVLQKRNEGNK